MGPIAGPKPNAACNSKNASDPVGIPLFGAPQAINPTPPKRVKAWVDGPHRPEVMYPVVEHTRTDCAARNPSRSRAPHHRTQSIAKKNELYLSYALPAYEYGTRPFLRWVLSQKKRAEYLSLPSHQTRLDTRSKARRPIKVGIKGRGRSRTSRDSNPACLYCSSAHLVQCAEYLSLPPTRHDLTQGQKPEGRLKWGERGGEGRERAETRTLLVCAAHRLT